MPRGRPRKNPLVVAPEPVPPPKLPWDDSADDIVADVLRRVFLMVPTLGVEIVLSIDKDVRQTWGGDRVYIPRRAGEGRSERNAMIRRDFANGERIGLLSRRYKLTPRQVSNIVSGN